MRLTKKVLFCIQIHLCLVYSKINKPHDKALRNIGGRDAAPGEFPYVLAMQYKIETNDTYFSSFCTCSLLKPTWCLTAAHCIDGLHATTNKVPWIKGIIKYNISLTHESPYSNILTTVVHPNWYSKRHLQNDIGFVQSEKVGISEFVKLSPINYMTLFGSKAMSLGYGITVNSDAYGDALSVNKTLQVLDVLVTKCQLIRPAKLLCLGAICGDWSTMCSGDSGGPVLHVSGLIGINTGSDFNPCVKKYVGKYKLHSAGSITPVSVYIDWIKKVID